MKYKEQQKILKHIKKAQDICYSASCNGCPFCNTNNKELYACDLRGYPVFKLPIKLDRGVFSRYEPRKM